MSVIGLKKANCKNCYKCLKVCPVKSIRVVNEQAQIIDDDCLLCGTCLANCPQNAKTLTSSLDQVKDCLLYTSQGFVYKGVIDNSGISIVGKGHLG